MRKGYLFAPGPTWVPPEVRSAMAAPIIHHRAPEFAALFERVAEKIKYVFQTQQPVLILASSGTGAMEAAVANIMEPGEKAIVVRGGKFGERWADLCKVYGAEPICIDVEWGKAVDPAQVGELLEQHPDTKAVFWQASETSTAVCHPTYEIAKVVKEKSEALTVVDGITAIGVFDVPMDKWGLDVVVSGSQKAFMLPPGLAFIALSERAWKVAERSTQPRYYFNLLKERKSQAKGQTAYTPAVSLIMGLEVALDMIKGEGLENVFARHERMANATRESMKAIGLKLLAPDAPSNAVTAIWAPEGIEGAKVPKMLRETYGITIAGGQEHLKGKIFRLSHMGYITEVDMIQLIAMTEVVLSKLGYGFEKGAAVAKAQELLFG